jgi:lipopolysaccharide export system ATP-binding protein
MVQKNREQKNGRTKPALAAESPRQAQPLRETVPAAETAGETPDRVLLPERGSTPRKDGPAPGASEPHELRAQALTKTYGHRTVVKDVTLTFKSGEVVGLLGPNGAGKTTTFYMVVGLVPPTSGTILLDGADITRMPMYQRARSGIAYLPQEPSVFRKLTVEENLRAVLEFTSLSPKDRANKVEEALSELNILALAHSPAYTLSGGERRRVEIARALVLAPRFLLLDEPFAGIDPIAVADIQGIILQMKQKGIGTVVSDHNVRETLKITDEAYIISDGAIFRHGSPSELATDAEVRRVYLGEGFTLD